MAIVPDPSTADHADADQSDLPPLPPLILLVLARWWDAIFAWLTAHSD